MTDFKKLMACLTEAEAACRARAAEKAADSRGDEANFEKIKANVYGIFKAVLETAMKVHGDGAEAETFFASKLRGIPSGWRSALTAAADKGDSAAAHTERLKLGTVAEIEKMFKEAAI